MQTAMRHEAPQQVAGGPVHPAGLQSSEAKTQSEAPQLGVSAAPQPQPRARRTRDAGPNNPAGLEITAPPAGGGGLPAGSAARCSRTAVRAAPASPAARSSSLFASRHLRYLLAPAPAGGAVPLPSPPRGEPPQPGCPGGIRPPRRRWVKE